MRRLLLTLFFGILAAAPLVLKAAGARLDILQSYAFPLCVLFAVLAGRRRFLRIPLAVPAFALVAWFGCLLYRELSVERKELKPLLEITPADHDPLGIRARSLHRKAAMVARTFKIEAPSLIEKSFRTSGEAYSWLRKRGDARLLVVGREENWDLVFGRAVEARGCGESCTGIEKEAER